MRRRRTCIYMHTYMYMYMYCNIRITHHSPVMRWLMTHDSFAWSWLPYIYAWSWVTVLYCTRLSDSWIISCIMSLTVMISVPKREMHIYIYTYMYIYMCICDVLLLLLLLRLLLTRMHVMDAYDEKAKQKCIQHQWFPGGPPPQY